MRHGSCGPAARPLLGLLSPPCLLPALNDEFVLFTTRVDCLRLRQAICDMLAGVLQPLADLDDPRHALKNI